MANFRSQSKLKTAVLAALMLLVCLALTAACLFAGISLKTGRSLSFSLAHANVTLFSMVMYAASTFALGGASRTQASFTTIPPSLCALAALARIDTSKTPRVDADFIFTNIHFLIFFYNFGIL